MNCMRSLPSSINRTKRRNTPDGKMIPFQSPEGRANECGPYVSESRTNTVPPLTERKAWRALGAHYQKLRPLHLRDLFAQDPHRGRRMSLEAAGLYLDYSKNRVTEQTLEHRWG